MLNNALSNFVTSSSTKSRKRQKLSPKNQDLEKIRHCSQVSSCLSMSNGNELMEAALASALIMLYTNTKCLTHLSHS